MKKLMVSFSILFLLLMTALGIPSITNAYELITVTETVTWNEEKIEFRKVAENFIVLYDTSSSMGETYKETGKKKIDLEREIFKSRTANFPDLSYNAGLYTFTPGAFKLAKTALKPFYEMKPLNKAEFVKAIEQLPTEASGPTLLQQGLLELDPILAPLKGHTVVFVVTDGYYSEWDFLQKPIDIAKDLARKYDVSFFVIDGSNSPRNPQLEYAVASINERSRVISFDQFLSNPLFISGALFVIDKRIVKKSADIEKVVGIKLTDALFAFDSAEINEKYAEPAKKLGEFMQKNPKAILSLAGFTDSSGTDAYNMGLSRRRVESVANYLVNNYQIARERIILNYYGEANPIADNKTAEGRSQNRRIEGFIFGME